MSFNMQIFFDIYVRIIFIHSFQSLKHPILWTTDKYGHESSFFPELAICSFFVAMTTIVVGMVGSWCRGVNISKKRKNSKTFSKAFPNRFRKSFHANSGNPSNLSKKYFEYFFDQIFEFEDFRNDNFGVINYNFGATKRGAVAVPVELHLQSKYERFVRKYSFASSKSEMTLRMSRREILTFIDYFLWTGCESKRSWRPRWTPEHLVMHSTKVYIAVMLGNLLDNCLQSRNKTVLGLRITFIVQLFSITYTCLLDDV